MGVQFAKVFFANSEYNITVGHQPFSNQVMLLTDRFSQWLAICTDKLFMQL